MPASVITLIRDDKLAVGWNPHRKGCELVGGKQQGTETMAQCAARELREETDIIADPAELSFYGFVDGPLDYVCMLYSLTLAQGVHPRAVESYGPRQFRWCDIGPDLQLRFPDETPEEQRCMTQAMQVVMDKYARRLRAMTTNEGLFRKITFHAGYGREGGRAEVRIQYQAAGSPARLHYLDVEPGYWLCGERPHDLSGPTFAQAPICPKCAERFDALKDAGRTLLLPVAEETEATRREEDFG